MFLHRLGLLVVVLLLQTGCPRQRLPERAEPTATLVRAERRAFDGAPPVIPHAPLGFECGTCHTATGKQVPHHGFAPANPHVSTSVAGQTRNCRQCHVFQRGGDAFVENAFVGPRPGARRGQRLYPAAPPNIPHAVFMRENCLACHDGPASRPEIRCSHPQRSNCRQCHLVSTTTDTFAALSKNE